MNTTCNTSTDDGPTNNSPPPLPTPPDETSPSTGLSEGSSDKDDKDDKEEKVDTSSMIDHENHGAGAVAAPVTTTKTSNDDDNTTEASDDGQYDDADDGDDDDDDDGIEEDKEDGESDVVAEDQSPSTRVVDKQDDVAVSTTNGTARITEKDKADSENDVTVEDEMSSTTASKEKKTSTTSTTTPTPTSAPTTAAVVDVKSTKATVTDVTTTGELRPTDVLFDDMPGTMTDEQKAEWAQSRDGNRMFVNRYVAPHRTSFKVFGLTARFELARKIESELSQDGIRLLQRDEDGELQLATREQIQQQVLQFLSCEDGTPTSPSDVREKTGRVPGSTTPSNAKSSEDHGKSTSTTVRSSRQVTKSPNANGDTQEKRADDSAKRLLMLSRQPVSLEVAAATVAAVRADTVKKPSTAASTTPATSGKASAVDGVSMLNSDLADRQRSTMISQGLSTQIGNTSGLQSNNLTAELIREQERRLQSPSLHASTGLLGLGVGNTGVASSLRNPANVSATGDFDFSMTMRPGGAVSGPPNLVDVIIGHEAILFGQEGNIHFSKLVQTNATADSSTTELNAIKARAIIARMERMGAKFIMKEVMPSKALWYRLSGQEVQDFTIQCLEEEARKMRFLRLSKEREHLLMKEREHLLTTQLLSNHLNASSLHPPNGNQGVQGPLSMAAPQASVLRTELQDSHRNHLTTSREARRAINEQKAVGLKRTHDASNGTSDPSTTAADGQKAKRKYNKRLRLLREEARAEKRKVPTPNSDEDSEDSVEAKMTPPKHKEAQDTDNVEKGSETGVTDSSARVSSQDVSTLAVSSSADTDPVVISGPIKIGEHDVLLGRGRGNFQNLGNRRLIDTFRNSKQAYNEASKKGKSDIARDIVKNIRNKGGRFLKKVDDDMWHMISDVEAFRKVSHGIRDLRDSEKRLQGVQNDSELSDSDQEGDGKSSGVTADGTIEPRDKDVVCGRGKALNRHPGNRRMSRIVRKHKLEYRDADSQDEKASIANTVLATVQSNGSRFLKFDANEGWQELPHKVALKKIYHSIRDAIYNEDMKPTKGTEQSEESNDARSSSLVDRRRSSASIDAIKEASNEVEITAVRSAPPSTDVAFSQRRNALETLTAQLQHQQHQDLQKQQLADVAAPSTHQGALIMAAHRQQQALERLNVEARATLGLPGTHLGAAAALQRPSHLVGQLGPSQAATSMIWNGGGGLNLESRLTAGLGGMAAGFPVPPVNPLAAAGGVVGGVNAHLPPPTGLTQEQLERILLARYGK